MGTLTIDLNYAKAVQYHTALTNLLSVKPLSSVDSLALNELLRVLAGAIEQREKLMNKEQAQND